MKKICSYTLSLTLALLVFFSFGGFIIAKADTCTVGDMIVTGSASSAVNGEYVPSTDINGSASWVKDSHKIYYESATAYIVGTQGRFDLPMYIKAENMEDPLGDYTGVTTDTNTVNVVACSITPPPPTPTTLVSFTNVPSLSEVAFNVSSISSGTINTFKPFLSFVLGFLIGWWLVNAIMRIFTGLSVGEYFNEEYQDWKSERKFLKGETQDKRVDRIIAESERLVKETTHLLDK